jgi:pimeloyl-ACP methyl ester carboxylesterase
METVTSKDGTKIAYDKQGNGPAVILVAGALCSRLGWNGPDISNRLAPHFTVYNYDRRGRGDSSDTLPYAVAREIEDIEALIDNAGGTAALYGHSSGASLALEAAAKLGAEGVTKLAMYEAPYNDEPEAKRAWNAYVTELTKLLAAGRRGDSVALFMKYVGTPDEHIEGMRHSPAWPAMEAIAPTLAYDHTAILGQEAAVPVALAATVQTPALVMSGSASFPFMTTTAKALSEAMPNARFLSLEGQTHDVKSDVIAKVLVEFFEN